MTAAVATAAVLMDVLDKVQESGWTVAFGDSSDMADGCRPRGWEFRFQLAHGPQGGGTEPTWAEELDHSAAHILAAEPGELDALRAQLVTHAALVATWVAALDARSKS